MSAKRALSRVTKRKHTPIIGGTCACQYGPDAGTGPACTAGVACLPVTPYAVGNRWAYVLSEGQADLPHGIRAGIRNWEPQLHRPDSADPAPF